MKRTALAAVLCAALVAGAALVMPIARSHTARTAGEAVRVYMTTADLSRRMARQPDLTFTRPLAANLPTITVDEGITYQRIDGFGAAFTDTSTWLLSAKLGASRRYAVLRRLFSRSGGIGLNVMRLPIAASDFTRDGTPYSYDDMPPGRMDLRLAHFSIAHDVPYTIPTIQQARRLNPALTIIATPWSPPAWMKTNGALTNARNSGHLIPSAAVDTAWARYMARFIQGYQAHGIPIAFITPNNEPSQPTDYPGLALPSGQESALVAHYLGPALAAARLHTEILAYDYFWGAAGAGVDGNAGESAYPFQVMGDSAARRYLAGTAWHCYIGNPVVMTQMHDAYPHKDNYETECSTGIAPGPPAELIIASSRNWAKATLLWNVALDQNGGPKQGNGCTGCSAPITINTGVTPATVTYTGDYYQLGQASAFVRPGAYRIASNTFVRYQTADRSTGTTYASADVDNVAFRNPDGSKVLLAYNNAAVARTFQVRWDQGTFRYTLPAGATVTFLWR